MKQKLILILIGIWTFTTVGAQNIKEQSKTMSMGSHNGFFMELEGAQKKNVEKLWKDYLKEYSKKVKKKKDEYYTEQGRIPLVNGSAELTVYSKLDEGRGLTTLYTWVDLGGAFMNSEDHGTQVEGFEQFLEDFHLIVKKDVINRKLEDEEKALKDLNKQLEKLTKKNEDYHNDISKAQEKIRIAEENIEKNLNQQNDKRVEIERQMKKIEKVIASLNAVGKN